ncbi:hypothetical protein IWZ01DRAFT_216074 [Phyllosticta capitalensis]
MIWRQVLGLGHGRHGWESVVMRRVQSVESVGFGRNPAREPKGPTSLPKIDRLYAYLPQLFHLFTKDSSILLALLTHACRPRFESTNAAHQHRPSYLESVCRTRAAPQRRLFDCASCLLHMPLLHFEAVLSSATNKSASFTKWILEKETSTALAEEDRAAHQAAGTHKAEQLLLTIMIDAGAQSCKVLERIESRLQDLNHSHQFRCLFSLPSLILRHSQRMCQRRAAPNSLTRSTICRTNLSNTMLLPLFHSPFHKQSKLTKSKRGKRA